MFTDQVSGEMMLLSFVYIVGTMSVFGLLLGMCLIDSGLVRRKNVLNVTVEKLSAAFLAGLAQAIVGYALWQYWSYRANDVPNPLKQAISDWWLGGNFLTNRAVHIDPAVLPEADVQQVFFIFFVTFGVIAAALIHSSGMERLRALPLYVMSAVVGLVLLPVVLALTWGPLTPLTTRGLHDFEGAFTIYIFVGTWSLILAWKLGPRLGRFEPHSSGTAPAPQNMSLVGLGALVIVMSLPFLLVGTGYIFPGLGYFGINMSESGMGIVFVNSLLAIIGGGVGGALIAYLRKESMWVFFGPVSGVVITATVLDVMYPWQCLLLGAFGPLIAWLTMQLMYRLRIDEAKIVPLALGPGVVGAIAGGFICWGTPTGGWPGLVGQNAVGASEITPLWQLIGVATVVVIAAVPCYLLCVLFKALGVLRVSEATEVEGTDLSTWGVNNYEDENTLVDSSAPQDAVNVTLGNTVGSGRSSLEV